MQLTPVLLRLPFVVDVLFVSVVGVLKHLAVQIVFVVVAVVVVAKQYWTVNKFHWTDDWNWNWKQETFGNKSTSDKQSRSWWK